MKADVTEDIPVQSGVSSYYSSLGKVDFYDGDNGRQFTTGVNSALQLMLMEELVMLSPIKMTLWFIN